MSKADEFESLVDQHGQTVTLYSFTAYASGAYVDSNWNAPDPESTSYPASGDAPGASYSAAQSVKAFVQPATMGKKGEKLVQTPWGEEVKVDLRAYFPTSVTVAHRDKVTHNGTDYWVAGIGEWYDGGTLVYRKVALTELVA